MPKTTVGIIGATKEETTAFLKMIEKPTKHIIATITFVTGLISKKQVIIATSGVGKVNAAMCAQLLISDFHCSYILNIGSAGAINDTLVAGDVVLAIDTVEHDFDATSFGYNPGQIPQMDTFAFKSDATLLELAQKIAGPCAMLGRIVSGDVFVTSPKRRVELVKLFDAVATDMESAAVGHVCYRNNVPFLAIRAISDSANENASVHFTKNIAKIANSPCDIAAALVRQF